MLSLDDKAEPPGFTAQPGSPAWEEAWAALIAEFGDPVCLDAITGESWQYHGTFEGADGWNHIFRHRVLPSTRQRTYRKYPATAPVS
ncbi:hypothetical protein FHW79_005390 [Azospirillum sp. OGB3]|uniref:hypothetical protein n=1 Tax=Azospirillum sp. OGB3 TaxID=2587012 RepID=UPI0016060E23|nr:hypothetical protein [Azospirillum sp. OGB3]MBB3267725.1 hypothetical protein [Azospirillum sp. OGB3]